MQHCRTHTWAIGLMIFFSGFRIFQSEDENIHRIFIWVFVLSLLVPIQNYINEINESVQIEVVFRNDESHCSKLELQINERFSFDVFEYKWDHFEQLIGR